VNLAQHTFLDTHGKAVTCWNHKGRDISTIIAGNTSQYAGNIRWFLVSSRAPPYHPPTIESKNETTNESKNESDDKNSLKILHLSDTHNLHWTIEQTYPMPEADIFIHTGDFSNQGTEAELVDFNNWLGTLKPRYRYIIMILGNHDTGNSFDIDTTRAYLNNATVLFHEEIQVEGLRIYGSPWVAKQPCHNPDNTSFSPTIFGSITNDLDILLTHGPPFDIFDKINDGMSWGSSNLLKMEIEKKRPKVHLFGHLHEQRGVWIKDQDNIYQGGVEFDSWPFPDHPPPNTYPCQIISCNAMRSHSAWDKKKRCIAGPARLIHAVKDNTDTWTFSTLFKKS